MRNLLLLTIAFFLGSISAFAQIDKGQIMLGINLGYTADKMEQPGPSSTTNEETLNTFIINPQIGFGLGNGLIAGVGVGYSSATYTDKTSSGGTSSEFEQKETMFSVDAFLRKFAKVSETFGVFGQLGVAYGTGEQETTPPIGSSSKDDLSMMSVGISPGLYLKPSSRFIIEATFGRLGYTSEKLETAGGTEIKSSQFQFALMNNLSFGVKFIL
ncbi:MAG TPA: outer membrane beta-barrel protein [Flavisolibacter sp.]